MYRAGKRKKGTNANEAKVSGQDSVAMAMRIRTREIPLPTTEASTEVNAC